MVGKGEGVEAVGAPVARVAVSLDALLAAVASA